MFAHVVAEIFEQRHLLGQGIGETFEGVEMFRTVPLNVLDVLAVGGQQHAGGVVEENAHTVVAELIAEAVLVRVVHPLADPVDGYACRVFSIIWNTEGEWLTLYVLNFSEGI